MEREKKKKKEHSVSSYVYHRSSSPTGPLPEKENHKDNDVESLAQSQFFFVMPTAKALAKDARESDANCLAPRV